MTIKTEQLLHFELNETGYNVNITNNLNIPNLRKDELSSTASFPLSECNSQRYQNQRNFQCRKLLLKMEDPRRYSRRNCYKVVWVQTNFLIISIKKSDTNDTLRNRGTFDSSHAGLSNQPTQKRRETSDMLLIFYEMLKNSTEFDKNRNVTKSFVEKRERAYVAVWPRKYGARALFRKQACEERPKSKIKNNSVFINS